MHGPSKGCGARLLRPANSELLRRQRRAHAAAMAATGVVGGRRAYLHDSAPQNCGHAKTPSSTPWFEFCAA